MRVLIAEDERITRMTLSRQLQGWGHEVTAAEDCQQVAGLLFPPAEFDIIITDWEMPRTLPAWTWFGECAKRSEAFTPMSSC